MPTLKYHLRFDEERLKKNRIICDETKGKAVHKRMDRGAKKYGPDHRELDEWHDPEAIRDMIDGMVASLDNIYPQTATDYLRIAYGHYELDKIASKRKRELNCSYSDLDWGTIFTDVYRNFKRNGYDKKVYQPRR
jgi:hypothetical protein